ETNRRLPASALRFSTVTPTVAAAPRPAAARGSIFERMLADDDGIAGRPRRYHVDRHARELLDALEVAPRGLRQRSVVRHVLRLVFPARPALVDRLALDVAVREERHLGRHLAVDAVTRAKLDLGQAVEHVELRETERGQTVREHGTPEQHGVEPAAAARPSRRRAELMADARQVLADRVRELGRERPGTDARRVRLHDTEHAVERRRTDTRAAQRTADRRIRRRDERIRAEIDVEHRALRTFEQDAAARRAQA